MLTDKQIEKFEKALQGTPPEWDPNWEITQQLLKLVTVQARYLINLQAQLDAVIQSNVASTESLVYALRQNMTDKQVMSSNLTSQEVQIAIDNLNHSIEAAATGQKAIHYAGNVLKFAAKLFI